MKYEVFAIRDNKSGAYMQPIFEVNELTASRNLKFALAQNTGVLGFSPQDFDFYKVATFDDQTGRFESLDVPEFVTNCLSAFPGDKVSHNATE